jgi:hypothetical protein
MKRITVVYEMPDDYDVTRITGTGELIVVTCVQEDAIAQLAEARAALETTDTYQKCQSLIRERDEARAERDVLLACRHGDQRCFECPDTQCCDNLKEKEGKKSE